MTPTQHGLLRHALGLDRRKSADRNALATGPGEDTYEHIESLVDAGFMMKGVPIPGGLTYFHATEAGIAAAKLAYEEFRSLFDAVRDYVVREVGKAQQTAPSAANVGVTIPPTTQPYEEE